MVDYDVWRVSDEHGPVLLYPRPTGDSAGATEQVRWARSGPDAEGVVAGTWSRARARLTGTLSAEVVDVEVPGASVVQRVATLAGADGACGWVPTALLAAASSTPTRHRESPSTTRARPASRGTSTRSATARSAAARPAERQQVPCRRCFMLRDPDTLVDGVCADGCD